MGEGKSSVPIKSVHVPFLYGQLKMKVVFRSTFFIVIYLFSRLHRLILNNSRIKCLESRPEIKVYCQYRGW